MTKERAGAGANGVRFPVAEQFVSVNGEGLASGQPAAFIRFAGCNLDCAYCDTRWANGPDAVAAAQARSADELVDWVRNAGVSAVTLTGGEPLLQAGLPGLVRQLLAVSEPRPLRVEVETNGSCSVAALVRLRDEAATAGLPGSLHLTVDWKTPAAGADACGRMLPEAFAKLDERDAVKFVVGSVEDVAFAGERATGAGLFERCAVLVSPVWDSVSPADVADALQRFGLHDARVQLQLHKIIWPNASRGV